MLKLLVVVGLVVVGVVSAYPAVEDVAEQGVKVLPTDGQGDLTTKPLEADLDGGDAGDGGDLKGSETFGFGYYPGYGRGFGYGGYGGYGGFGWGRYGGYGGYGRGWGWGGYPRRYYW